MAQIDLPTVPAHPVPTYNQPATASSNKAKSDQLAELEKWAAELGYNKCVLETGKKQPEAIALYKRSGYKIIPNYGQYIGIENSVCFEKAIR